MSQPFQIGLALALKGGIFDMITKTNADLVSFDSALKSDGVMHRDLSEIGNAYGHLGKRPMSNLPTTHEHNPISISKGQLYPQLEVSSLTPDLCAGTQTNQLSAKVALQPKRAVSVTSQVLQTARPVSMSKVVLSPNPIQTNPQSVTLSQALPAVAATPPTDLQTPTEPLDTPIKIPDFRYYSVMQEGSPIVLDRALSNVATRSIQNFHRSSDIILSPMQANAKQAPSKGIDLNLGQVGMTTANQTRNQTSPSKTSLLAHDDNEAAVPGAASVHLGPAFQIAESTVDGNQIAGDVSNSMSKQSFSKPPIAPTVSRRALSEHLRNAPTLEMDGLDGGSAALKSRSDSLSYRQSDGSKNLGTRYLGNDGELNSSSSDVHDQRLDNQSVAGDVFFDGALVGRWISRMLTKKAERATTGPTGYDVRRGRLLLGPSAGV